MENDNINQNSVDDLVGKVFNINLNGPATDENNGKKIGQLAADFIAITLLKSHPLLFSAVTIREQAQKVDVERL
jgi:hypothetical protein